MSEEKEEKSVVELAQETLERYKAASRKIKELKPSEQERWIKKMGAARTGLEFAIDYFKEKEAELNEASDTVYMGIRAMRKNIMDLEKLLKGAKSPRKKSPGRD